MEKPVTMRINELKNSISKCVNESGLPAFLVEYVLSEITRNVSDFSKKQAAEEREMYLQSMEEKKDGDDIEQGLQ